MTSDDLTADANGSAAPALSVDTRQRLLRALSEFNPPREDSRSDQAYRIPLSHSALPVPRLVKWVLQEVVGGEDSGRDEKLAWDVRFRFRSHDCSIAYQKFGLRLYVSATNTAEPVAREIHDDILGGLQKAIRIAAKEVFADFAEMQVRAGRVTVRNQLHKLRMMYEYFREAAEHPAASRSEGSAPANVIFPGEIDAVRFHNAVAMVNAYFSLFEHCLVLVWPFVSYLPGSDDLERFIGDRWSDKFKKVFNVAVPGEAKLQYDRLRAVAEEYRNTYSHGGFDKQRETLFVHMDEGPIPANLTDAANGKRFEFFPIQAMTIVEILEVFDKADAWLREGPARYGLAFAEAGFDVPFDSGSIQAFREAMKSTDGFNEYISRLAYQIDQVSNMDW